MEEIHEFVPQGSANTALAFALCEDIPEVRRGHDVSLPRLPLGSARDRDPESLHHAQAFTSRRINDEEMMWAPSLHLVKRPRLCNVRDITSSHWAFARFSVDNLTVTVVEERTSEFRCEGPTGPARRSAWRTP